MDIIEIVGWACFIYLGWQLLKSWIFVQGLKHRIATAVEEELVLRQTEKQVGVVQFDHVEQGSHSVVLVYEHKTNQFLGQANTQEEAETMLQNRYPTKGFVIVNEKATVKGTINAVDAKSV
jgi:hypothetical protein